MKPTSPTERIQRSHNQSIHRSNPSVSHRDENSNVPEDQTMPPHTSSDELPLAPHEDNEISNQRSMYTWDTEMQSNPSNIDSNIPNMGRNFPNIAQNASNFDRNELNHPGFMPQVMPNYNFRGWFVPVYPFYAPYAQHPPG
jgi:hypothetical protein